MNIVIVTFSPHGNTKKIGKIIADYCTVANIKTESIDITGNRSLWIKKDFKSFFSNIPKHDILMVGSPVYAHTIPKILFKFLDTLPEPDSIFSKYTIPFVSYGNVSSGTALYNLALKLKEKMRTSIMGLKINTSHSLCQSLTENQDNLNNFQKPITLVQDLINKLKNTNIQQCHDITDYLLYQKNYKKPVEPKFPDIEISHNRCKTCKKCISVCPVNRLNAINNKIVFQNTNCIHCGECFFNCKFNAIEWDITSYNSFLQKVIDSKEPLAETKPYNAIY